MFVIVDIVTMFIIVAGDTVQEDTTCFFYQLYSKISSWQNFKKRISWYCSN